MEEDIMTTMQKMQLEARAERIASTLTSFPALCCYLLAELISIPVLLLF